MSYICGTAIKQIQNAAIAEINHKISWIQQISFTKLPHIKVMIEIVSTFFNRENLLHGIER